MPGTRLYNTRFSSTTLHPHTTPSHLTPHPTPHSHRYHSPFLTPHMVSLLITLPRVHALSRQLAASALTAQIWTDSVCMPAAAPAVLMALWLQNHQLTHFYFDSWQPHRTCAHWCYAALPLLLTSLSPPSPLPSLSLPFPLPLPLPLPSPPSPLTSLPLPLPSPPFSSLPLSLLFSLHPSYTGMHQVPVVRKEQGRREGVGGEGV